MKLMFIQGGTRLKQDNNGNWYTDGTFNDSVWARYLEVCDQLTVVLRKENTMFEQIEAERRFNKFNTKSIRLVPLRDLYKPIVNYFSFSYRKEIYNQIKKEIENSDKIIIRSVINYYTIIALKLCKKLNKPYLVEVTGVAWDANWYHSIRGKMTALITEIGVKRRIKNAPYALYVTQFELQKRYPCNGKTIGCSDVELKTIDEYALERRLKNIKKNKNVILGTIGNCSLKTKGHNLVIKALGKLKKRGISNIQYQIVGGGDVSKLKKEAKKQGVLEQVEFVGAIPHDKVFSWLDGIDIYIQPSYQEGLCRSVVEAMSRACPVICSNACGESELADEKYIFKRGDWITLAELIISMSTEEMRIQAKRSYNKALEYRKEILDIRRKKFYLDFIKN